MMRFDFAMRKQAAFASASIVPENSSDPSRSPVIEDRRESTTRILLVTPGGMGERGGIGRLVNYVIRHCSDRDLGLRFTVVDPYGPRRLTVMPFCFARGLAQVTWEILRGRVDIVHVNIASWGSVARKGLIVHLVSAMRRPIVLHLHAGDFEHFYGRLPGIGQRFVRGIFARSSRIVVLGEPWRAFLRDRLGVEARRIVVLENAIAGPVSPPERGRAQGPCRLLFLGRIEAEKGVPELLEALADPQMADLNWRATFGGAGDIATYRRKAEALGIAAKLEFVGWQAEAAALALLERSDVFVLPSHFEGLSMAILEAMAFGLAIVCTPVGSLPSALEDDVSALFVPVGQPVALADALARVISDLTLRATLQREARAQFNRKFDIGPYCSVLSRLYEEVLRERPGE